jgi:uncharacterized membrane protein
MKNLSTVVFIIPFIALILAVLGYLILLKKETSKAQFKQLVFIIIIAAFVLNFIWEMLQMPFYKGMENNLQSAAVCALAAIADAIMVLLIYFCFAFVYKKVFWVQQLSFFRISMLALVGGIGAILAELRHTALGTWTYNKSMPLLPFNNVGLIPVLQFMILPVCIFYLSNRFIKIKEKHINYGSQTN